MEERKVYIKSATHISLQEPLAETWMNSPVLPAVPYQRSQDPDFRPWLPPLESRRMGKLLRRALVTARKALADGGVMQPDAIMTGTGLGCIDSTLLFLDQLSREGESLLKPTHFMQSTHNTISSLIAIKTQCHGYNATYSHRSLSFDSALMDAFIQLRSGDIATALVTGNDELPPACYELLQRSGCVGQPRQVPAAEASAALLLGTDGHGCLCEISRFVMSSCPTGIAALAATADAVLTGYSGHPANDRVYDQLCGQFGRVPLLRYKHLFGECFTASALGLYAAACVVRTGFAPAFLRMDGIGAPLPVRRLLVVNHSDGQEFSGILLNHI